MTQERRTVGKASDVIRRAFSIHNDSAGYDEIQQRILSGAEVKGTNLCVLILAIFIASNVSSGISFPQLSYEVCPISYV